MIPLIINAVKQTYWLILGRNERVLIQIWFWMFWFWTNFHLHCINTAAAVQQSHARQHLASAGGVEFHYELISAALLLLYQQQ